MIYHRKDSIKAIKAAQIKKLLEDTDWMVLEVAEAALKKDLDKQFPEESKKRDELRTILRQLLSDKEE